MNDQVAKFLEHSGVKGMKWGVRNDKGHEGKPAKTKKIAKLDKKFDKNADSMSTLIKINNAAAKKSTEIDVPRINNKPEYKNADFTRESPLRRKYYKEHQDAFMKRLDEAANDMGTNASGTKKYGISDIGPLGFSVVLKDVKHADGDKVSVKYVLSDTGHIQGLELEDDVIEHHGVKGMRWGVRNRRGQGVRKATKPAEPKKSGDSNRSSDGKLTSTPQRRMTDKELQAAVNRLNLERQYRQLTNETKKKSKGREFAESIAMNVARTQIQNTANALIGKELEKRLKIKVPKNKNDD